jgi:hypothetical protein
VVDIKITEDNRPTVTMNFLPGSINNVCLDLCKNNHKNYFT